MDGFDRPSKRRRTGTYATRRRTLNTADEEDSDTKDVQNGTHDRDITDEKAVESVKDRSNEVEETEAAKPVSRTSSTRKRRQTNRALDTSADPTSDTNGGRPPKSTTADEAGDIEKAPQCTPGGQEVDEVGNDEEDEPEETTQQRRSSGRARRAPRRFSHDPEPLDKPLQPQTKSSQKSQPRPRRTKDVNEDNGTVAPSPQPKGILTPSRHGRGKKRSPRKSVVFDADEQQIEEQLGFKDINTSSKSKASTKITNNVTDTSPSKRSSQQKPTGSKAVTTGTDLLLENVDDEDDEIEIEPAPNVDDILSWNNNNTKTTGIGGTQRTSLHEQQEDVHITEIKTEILSRITGRSLPAISNLQTQYDTLHSLLEATIAAGESNSLLLLGSRGSGKSLLISHALADLSRSHGNDFHVVRLNGFFQTDDKLALREIWRQLGREMAVSEDETGEVTSYADTMASLLSLLSHPEEFTDPNAMMLDGTNEEEVNKTAKSVVFVLDEFDLFTTHPRQTLLYNLFDIAQARKAPIAVIGCSTRMDVVDCLEKRVKSRFSHRWLHIPSMMTLQAFEDAVTNTLTMPVDGKEALGVSKDDLEWRQRWNTVIKTQLISQPSIQDLMKKTFYSTKSIPDVLAALYIPIATLSVPHESDGSTTADDNDIQEHAIHGMVKMATMSNSSPSLLTVLPQLPTLHLSLLIAAARLETIHSFGAANFALVYNHYVELLKRSRLQRSSLSARSHGAALTGAGFRQWSKSTATGAWEDLAQWEMIVPVSRAAVAGGGSKFGEDTLGGDSIGVRMFRVDVALDEIAWAVRERLGAVGAGEVLSKWCNEV